ncbi:MAG TPA: DinB family protein [Candidatus Limnocylindrales bacterium]|nr:DinB family protein [Candidatus Limnocylindrales bacterium]
MTDATLLAAIRHNNWANKELVDFCARLSPEQQSWTSGGTYGSIHACLQHILGAESGYLHSLTGGELPPGGRLPDTLVPFERLTDLARSNSERIEKVIANEKDPERKITRPSGAIVPASIIVAQFIHHGSDHRAHVGSILGAHGVEGPNLDAWAYGRAIGVSTAATR